MLEMLVARRLVTPSETLDHPVIRIADGVIASIDSDPHNGAGETTLTPTFFDIHTHGAAHHDVMEATVGALDTIGGFLATRGVGHYLPTTVTAPVDTTLRSLEGIADVIEGPTREGVSRPIGIHLEGPFISHAKRGVHPPADIQPPSVSLLERFQQAARGHIRLMTVAPEIPGALEMIAYAKSLGIHVSIGHTNATAKETLAAINAGAVSATHTFNAMRPLDHREPGVLGIVLDSDRLFAELICDGVHVAPELVRLWLKAKGPERGILVTDSMSATGMPEGIYTLGTFAVKVADGRAFAADDLLQGKETLAGSVLTMDRAVANLQRFTGASLGTAVQMASHNPAVMLGVMDKTAKAAVGQPANFNLFNEHGELTRTILNGSAVESSRH